MSQEPVKHNAESGVALVMVLLIMALLLALVMGISMTSISESGVSNTYANQERAFQSAEAGLYHALNLVRNYDNHSSGGSPNFTKLLAERSAPISTNYLLGNNPFDTVNSGDYLASCSMIDDAKDGSGNTLLNSAGNPLGHQLIDAAGNPVDGTYYNVHVIDDEKTTGTAEVKVPNFSPTGIWEDGDAIVDTNNRIVVYSTGTYANASITLEGWIGFVPYPAIVAQEDITVWGNSVIAGAYGGVHSNNNLAVGASAHVAQTATAVNNFSQGGSAQIDGFHAGGQPAMYVPKFVTTEPLPSGGPNTNPRLQDYIIQRADTVLIDPGYRGGVDRQGRDGLARSNALADRLNVDAAQLRTAISSTDSANAITITRSCPTCPGTVALVDVATAGWKYTSGSGWDVQGVIDPITGKPVVDNHTFYAIGLDNYTPGNPQPNGGNIKITSNLGSDTSPIHITLLSTGSIEIDGTPNMVANLTNLSTPELPPFVTIDALAIAVEDIKIRGDAGVPKFSGVIYAGEQFDLSGNGSFDGQVIGLSNTDVPGSPVSDNSVSGSFELTFNGGQALGTVKLMSWRQIKE